MTSAAAIPTRRQLAAGRARPFLKWAGGKRSLADQLLARFPARFGTYHEPFLGGGAVFFALRPVRARLSDSNEELIAAYHCVRDALPELVAELHKHNPTSEHFYRVRALNVADLSPAAAAARTIFLNRTCFNGLYRVNSRGEFNVPFGSHRNPKICDEANLARVRDALRGVTIESGCVFDLERQVRRRDLVYFDPPYYPVSMTSSFTRYTLRDFGPEHQERLAELFARLVARGVHCVLSNSDTPFVRKLYRRFHIESVLARRAINSCADRRHEVGEVIVTSSSK